MALHPMIASINIRSRPFIERYLYQERNWNMLAWFHILPDVVQFSMEQDDEDRQYFWLVGRWEKFDLQWDGSRLIAPYKQIEFQAWRYIP